MTFREDESRARERHVAENLSWLRRFALGLLKQHPDDKISLVSEPPRLRLEHRLS